MTHLQQDLRHVLRQIRKAPGFALTTILTLAVAIGATTAIFSFIDGVLLQPLAYPESGRLAAIWEHVPFLKRIIPVTGPNPRHAVLWREAQTSFTDLSIVNEGTTGVALAGDHPRYVGRVLAEPNLLSLLGVQPALGRDFLPEEGSKGHTDRVIISWPLWKDVFAGSPEVLGKTLLVGDTPMLVIGVLPQGFYFPKANELTYAPSAQQSPAVDILLPNRIDVNDVGWNGDYGNYEVIGRLKPGVTPAAARQQLDTITANFARQAPAGTFEPGPSGAVTTVVEPLKQAIVGRSTTGLWLLLAAVGSMLLIACINLANAQLARVMARDKEAALRTALGASPWHLVQGSLLESFLLAGVGGSLGVLLAHVALRRFAGFVHVAIPRSGNISLNPTVLAVSTACTIAATVLFGALPALRFLHVRPQAVLGSAERATNSTGGTTLRRMLICAQMLACTALLLLTTLFARNLLELLHGANGFSTGGTVLVNARLQGKALSNAAIASFDQGVLDRLRPLPGVTSVALVSSILSQGSMWVDGVKVSGMPNQEPQLAQFRWISPGYFSTVGQRIVAGRALQDGDRTPVIEDGVTLPAGRPAAAVLSETAAQAIWPQQDPLNRTFTWHYRMYMVVGVAADARTNSPRELPASMVFLPFWDNPPSRVFFLVHGSQDPALLAPAVRQAIWSYNPSVTLADVGPLEATLADTLAPERLQTTLLAVFAGATLLLALVGIYGTLNYSIGRRTKEFGIRMALGATRGNVFWITLTEVLAPIAGGLLGGLLLSLALARVLHSLLTGVPRIDPSSSLGILCLLLLITLLATYLPCRRASHVEPTEALRAD